MYLMQEKSEAAEDNSSLESHKQIAVILNAALPPPPVNQPPTRSTPPHPPSTTFHLAPGQSRGRMAVGGPWESGLGWGPLTNTQPNVLIDPMPSYFRTSVRRQGAARRDRQSAALRELEQGEEEEWME
ncbi:hypothetical protein NQZ68_002025 [Dissostichus eleginoides]|nr:hypothetical protein NQZ68_002025 [Dissostichus eleginoides]